MAEAFIVAAARTAGGRRGGRLAGWHPADLAAQVRDALVARTGADHQGAAHQRFLQGIDHLRSIQHIGRTGRARDSLATGEIFGSHQYQTRQPHVFHRPRGTADIARMTGAHQNHANIVQQRRRSQKSQGGAMILPKPFD